MSALPFRPRAPGPAADAEYLPAGTVLQQRYEIIREIGRGGYSVVFLARDRVVDTRVAIKLLAPPPAAAREARERLRREVQAARGLTQGNIVAVHDLLEDGPRMFVVMEYVDGPDLSVQIRERGPLTPAGAAALGRDIGAALVQAHRRGVLHRDIKPQNILLGPDDRARLTDFGAARIDSRESLTGTGGLVGTLPYIAPEVLTGERGDARSDIYGLGMTLYFALTGGLPARPAVHLPPPPQPDGYRPRSRQPAVPDWLDDAVACATAALPGDRFSSAAALVDALDRREGPSAYAPEPRAPRLDFCLSCGAADSLGAGLCPSCAAAPGSTADTLIYLQPAVSPAERKFIEEAVRVLAGESPELRTAVEGQRPLARVPAGAAESVLNQLSRHHIPARAQPGRWLSLPPSFLLVLGGMLATGLVAGMMIFSPLLWGTPVIVAALWWEAQRQGRRPILRGRSRRARLPEWVQAPLTDVFARLPEGSARSLLGDLVRAGQDLYDRQRRTGDAEGIQASVAELLRYAPEAALDLAALDATLERFEQERERFPRVPPGWSSARTRCERTRDALVQRMLDVISTLGDARQKAAWSSSDAERLHTLGSALHQEVQAHAEAVAEVEELLRTP